MSACGEDAPTPEPAHTSKERAEVTRPPTDDEYALPEGWEWAAPEWSPLPDPVWKWVRFAKQTSGSGLANFESRGVRDA